MRIDLTRSGGLAAIDQTTAVETDELPEADARELQNLVEEIDFADLAERSPIRGRGADRFQYDVVVSDQGKRRAITVGEDAAPPELRALIDWLLASGKDAGRGRPAS